MRTFPTLADIRSAPLRGRRRGVMHALARSLARDERGVSTVEFAFTTPVLLALILGMSEVTPSVMARLQVNHATEATGDVTTEYSQMQASDMVNVFSASVDMLAPFNTSTLAVRITNVYSDGNGHAYVYWSCGQGALPPLTAKSAVTSTPTGTPLSSLLVLTNQTSGGYTMVGTNTSYVMAESQYVYTAPVQYISSAPRTFTYASYILPRQSSYVGFPWDGISTDAAAVPASTTKTKSITLSNGAVCNYAY